MNDISTEHAMIATERVMRAFGDVIGGRRDIMERIMFKVITGDLTIDDDDEEEGECFSKSIPLGQKFLPPPREY